MKKIVSVRIFANIYTMRKSKKTYSLIVECEEKGRRKYSLAMWRLGLRWNEDAFYGIAQYKKYEKVKNYCREHGLTVKIDNEFAERSSNYRTAFFRTHSSQIGKYYLCSYCGKLLTKDKVTVDHLYPVKKARTSQKVQQKLRKMGYKDVNDPRNLVPACSKCNSRKAAKMGGWIIRGEIGQITWLWIVRKIVRLLLVCGFVYFVYRSGAIRDILGIVENNALY